MKADAEWWVYAILALNCFAIGHMIGPANVWFGRMMIFASAVNAFHAVKLWARKRRAR